MPRTAEWTLTSEMSTRFQEPTLRAIRYNGVSRQAAQEMLRLPAAALSDVEAHIAVTGQISVRALRAIRSRHVTSMSPIEQRIARVRTPRTRRTPTAAAAIVAPRTINNANGADACVSSLAVALNAVASNPELNAFAVRINELIDDMQALAEVSAA